jgi:hypothetical protein
MDGVAQNFGVAAQILDWPCKLLEWLHKLLEWLYRDPFCCISLTRERARYCPIQSQRFVLMCGAFAIYASSESKTRDTYS